MSIYESRVLHISIKDKHKYYAVLLLWLLFHLIFFYRRRRGFQLPDKITCGTSPKRKRNKNIFKWGHSSHQKLPSRREKLVIIKEQKKQAHIVHPLDEHVVGSSPK